MTARSRWNFLAVASYNESTTTQLHINRAHENPRKNSLTAALIRSSWKIMNSIAFASSRNGNMELRRNFMLHLRMKKSGDVFCIASSAQKHFIIMHD